MKSLATTKLKNYSVGIIFLKNYREKINELECGFVFQKQSLTSCCGACL